MKRVEHLLRWGADVRFVDKRPLTEFNGSVEYARMTPLHWAANGGHTAVVARLIRAGAPVNALTGVGLTPLHLAARAGHSATVELLLTHGAAANRKSHYGETPIYSAVRSGKAEVLPFLWLYGANINMVQRTLMGEITPIDYALTMAIRNGLMNINMVRCAQLLILYGAVPRKPANQELYDYLRNDMTRVMSLQDRAFWLLPRDQQIMLYQAHPALYRNIVFGNFLSMTRGLEGFVQKYELQPPVVGGPAVGFAELHDAE